MSRVTAQAPIGLQETRWSSYIQLGKQMMNMTMTIRPHQKESDTDTDAYKYRWASDMNCLISSSKTTQLDDTNV